MGRIVGIFQEFALASIAIMSPWSSHEHDYDNAPGCWPRQASRHAIVAQTPGFGRASTGGPQALTTPMPSVSRSS